MVTSKSVLIFILNNENHDYAILVVDIYTQKVIIYDALESRSKETFLLHVKNIKRFIGDYCDNMSLTSSLVQKDEQLELEFGNLSLNSSISFTEGGQ